MRTRSAKAVKPLRATQDLLIVDQRGEEVPLGVGAARIDHA